MRYIKDTQNQKRSQLRKLHRKHHASNEQPQLLVNRMANLYPFLNIPQILIFHPFDKRSRMRVLVIVDLGVNCVVEAIVYIRDNGIVLKLRHLHWNLISK